MVMLCWMLCCVNQTDFAFKIIITHTLDNGYYDFVNFAKTLINTHSLLIVCCPRFLLPLGRHGIIIM